MLFEDNFDMDDTFQQLVDIYMLCGDGPEHFVYAIAKVSSGL